MSEGGDDREVLQAVARVGAQVEALNGRVSELRQEVRADTEALHRRINQTLKEVASKSELRRVEARQEALENRVEALAVDGAGRAGETRGERNVRKGLWAAALTALGAALAWLVNKAG